MGSSAAEDTIAQKYGNELISLRINSKPIINSLTMMAEDYLKQAPTIVQVIEKHLARAKPDVKLPILYLIDSIVKNVKNDYVNLFTQNLVSTFVGTFEKVDEKTRSQMFKLRQTWTDIFSFKKLYAIDVKAHELDPNWPIAKIQNSSIHLNPKFLTLKNPSANPARSPTYEAGKSGSSISVDIDEAKMREQLLIKQKELIELQQKKLELELLQTKAQLEEQAKRKQVKVQEVKQEQLMKRVEVAKQQTSKATSMLAKAESQRQAQTRRSNSPAVTPRSSSPVVKDSSSHSQSQRVPPMIQDKTEKFAPDPRLARLAATKPQSLKLTDDSKLKPVKEEKKSPKSVKSVTPEPSTVDKHKTKIESKDIKPEQIDSNEQKRKKKRHTEEDEEKVDKEKSKSPKSKVSPTKSPPEKKDRDSKERSRPKSDNSSSPEKRDKDKHRSNRSKSKETERNSSRSSKEPKDNLDKVKRERLETDNTEVAGRKVKPEKEQDKDSLNDRKSAVLARSYRKRPEARFDEDKEKSKTKIGSDSSTPGDVDLRFEGLQDVDLRTEGSDTTSEEPAIKKPRINTTRSALIDDLFGPEDMDLRQPSGTNWSQVKKPSSHHSSTPRKESTDSEHPKADKIKVNETEVTDQDIRHILSDVGNRPPPAVSPANSVDSNRSTCDPLGRPLLFSRLSIDPEERKRSYDSRSMSVDPVEQFRLRYLEKPGGLTSLDLNIAFGQAKIDLEAGKLNLEQHNTIVQKLIQLNEVEKIREFQEMRNPNGPVGATPAPSPWVSGKKNMFQDLVAPNLENIGLTMFMMKPLGSNVWAVDVRPNFLQHGGGGNRFTGPWATNNQWPTPVTKPVGPNPFEAAIAQPDDLIPDVNSIELKNAERDSDATIPLDKVLRQIRFYGEMAVVFVGMLGDEPRDISFQRLGPRTVYINKVPFKCFIGENKFFYIDNDRKKRHTIRIGTPKRELYVDDEPYEACFTGAPVRVHIEGKWHNFRLEGPPPQVEIGKIKRYDLVAGRVTLFIDANSTSVYLDENPQLLHLGGVPVIFRFCNHFHNFTLNGRIFPTSFGGRPISVTLRNGRQHFLRLAGVSRATEAAMSAHFRTRQQNGEEIPQDNYFGRGGRGGRGIRGRGDMGRGRGLPFSNRPDIFEAPLRHDEASLSDQRLEDNPLDMLATIFPTATMQGHANQKNSYESESVEGVDDTSKVKSKDTGSDSAASLNVQDLLSKLMMAGLLPTSAPTKETEPKNETPDKSKDVVRQAVTEEAKDIETPMETSEPPNNANIENEKPAKPVVPQPPPLEVVDLTFNDNLKERRIKLVNQVCTGVQCGSCGLRFGPDQSFRYTQHLDWHFRLNRREKANSRKAQSRRWYYDLSDWIQFEEVEDLEERAASLFEFQEAEKADGDEKETSAVLNPDAYTVVASGFEKAQCPQCGEGFETFYDSEEEEWKLRDALIGGEEESEKKLFHPICHEDYLASLAKQAAEPMDETSEIEESTTNPGIVEESAMETNKEEDEVKTVADDGDDDEVLILKEGKKEVVIDTVEIDIDEDVENNVSNNVIEMITESEDNTEKMSKDKINENESETEKNNNLSENNETTSVSNNIDDSNNISSTSNKPILSPIVIHVEDDSNIPGITTSQDGSSSVFDFALSSSNTNSQRQDSSKSELPPITYNSMQFDFPKIKVEPPEWETVDENQVIMNKEFLVDGSHTPMDITLDDDDSLHSPPPVTPAVEQAGTADVDIDLTGEDDNDSSQSTPITSLNTAIDGNLEMRSEAKAPLMSIPTKIRINIAGLETRAASLSPGHPGSSQEDTSKKSPRPQQPSSPKSSNDEPSSIKSVIDNKSSNSPSGIDDDNEKKLEEIKRLKPRLVGKKLVNCPPRKTGKEESGLCIIS